MNLKPTPPCYLLALFLVGCDQTESPIVPGAGQRIAENMGKAEQERFLRARLPLAELEVERTRQAVTRATLPGEIALAVEDLRAATAEVARIENAIKATFH